MPQESRPTSPCSEGPDYLDLLLRVQADFINFKRRVGKEIEECASQSKASVLVRLFPVLDDLRRAERLMPERLADDDWAQGISLISRKLSGLLREEGVTRIHAEGKHFDPREHEAVFCQDAAGTEEGKVVAVLLDGYKLNGRVIRPAQVSVCKKVESLSQESEGG